MVAPANVVSGANGDALLDFSVGNVFDWTDSRKKPV